MISEIEGFKLQSRVQRIEEITIAAKAQTVLTRDFENSSFLLIARFSVFGFRCTASTIEWEAYQRGEGKNE